MDSSLNKPYFYRGKYYTKFQAQLLSIWVCIKYFFCEFKIPPPTMRAWYRNLADERDVEVARKRALKREQLHFYK